MVFSNYRGELPFPHNLKRLEDVCLTAVSPPFCTAQNLQAPVENLGPILSLNKLWNAPGRIVNLSPLQTKCPNSHLPSVGSHRALGVLQSPLPGRRGQLDHYICTKSKQPAQFGSVHRDEKEGGTKYRPLGQFICLKSV